MASQDFDSSSKRPHQPGVRRYVRKHYAIPPEHGAWVWWIGPLIVGAAAGGTLHADFIVLIVTALAAFLVRQPLTLLVKVLSGLRPASDRAPAIFWSAIYGGICAVGAAGLVALGHARVLLLGLLAAPLLLRYFFLVSRKSERHQRGMEYATAAVLALALPAAYWVCGGASSFEPWILWGLVTLHSVTTVIHVSKILELRRTKRLQDRRDARRVL
ncbi:MAG: YwiC-like family protein, partial [Candidatus Hydrogenedentes bacterium]|nr:YwiC-like family protein [Candidatus Hydrogenedentota bacterium]